MAFIILLILVYAVLDMTSYDISKGSKWPYDIPKGSKWPYDISKPLLYYNIIQLNISRMITAYITDFLLEFQ